jgi:hypothetical protein
VQEVVHQRLFAAVGARSVEVDVTVECRRHAPRRRPPGPGPPARRASERCGPPGRARRGRHTAPGTRPLTGLQYARSSSIFALMSATWGRMACSRVGS